MAGFSAANLVALQQAEAERRAGLDAAPEFGNGDRGRYQDMSGITAEYRNAQLGQQGRSQAELRRKQRLGQMYGRRRTQADSMADRYERYANPLERDYGGLTAQQRAVEDQRVAADNDAYMRARFGR